MLSPKMGQLGKRKVFKKVFVSPGGQKPKPFAKFLANHGGGFLKELNCLGTEKKVFAQGPIHLTKGRKKMPKLKLKPIFFF